MQRLNCRAREEKDKTHMDMSQNEVSVFGSEMVPLREKSDTSF